MATSKPNRSLRGILLLAWVLPALFAVFLSLSAFLALGWIDYRNATERVSAELAEKSRAVARRLSAEALLGERGALEPVAAALRADLGLKLAGVRRANLPCQPAANAGDEAYCIRVQGKEIFAVRALPFIQDPQFAVISSVAPGFWPSLNYRFLLWGILPLAFVLGLGVWAQRRLLERYLLRPIETIAAHSQDGGRVPKHWPSELATLSDDLRRAMRQRDQALVGQLASGVIHDLKTLLHSLVSATALVREQEEGSPKRAQRLDLLLRACSTNLPKMQRIIESTLDGSREIHVSMSRSDIRQTVAGAIGANEEYAVRCRVALEFNDEFPGAAVDHDSVQLERALTNLVKNAIEAVEQSDSGSERRVQLSLRGAMGGQIEISVEDSGPGLNSAPDDLFSSVRSTKVHGAGLGLLVSRKIVEAHRGRLTAATGRTLSGARFEVTFPAGGGAK